jgi:hypothetical protein
MPLLMLPGRTAAIPTDRRADPGNQKQQKEASDTGTKPLPDTESLAVVVMVVIVINVSGDDLVGVDVDDGVVDDDNNHCSLLCVKLGADLEHRGRSGAIGISESPRQSDTGWSLEHPDIFVTSWEKCLWLADIRGHISSEEVATGSARGN